MVEIAYYLKAQEALGTTLKQTTLTVNVGQAFQLLILFRAILSFWR